MAEVLGQGRRRAAQGNRRGDDGLQERARGVRRRPRARHGLAAREGPRQGGQARPTARPPRVRSRRSSTATSASSSSSTATPTSSPRAPSSPARCSATRQARRGARVTPTSPSLPFEGSTVGETLTQLAAKLGENVVARPRRALRVARRPARRATRTTRTTAAPSACSSSSAGSTRRTSRRARSRTRSRCTSSFAAPAYLTRDEVPADVRRARAGGHRGEEPQRGRARGQARRVRSRVGSTRSTRTSCSLEQAFGEGPEGHASASWSRASAADATLAAVRPRQGGRGLAFARHERASVDGREPVPPRGAQAVG